MISPQKNSIRLRCDMKIQLTKTDEWDGVWYRIIRDGFTVIVSRDEAEVRATYRNMVEKPKSPPEILDECEVKE